MTRILFLGRLRDAAGAGERIATLPAAVRTTGDLIAWLAAGDVGLHRALSDPSVKVVADQEIVARGGAIDSAREIAFLPPVSGG